MLISGSRPLYETVKECHGASPSVILSMTLCKSLWLAKGGVPACENTCAAHRSRSLSMWGFEICVCEKSKSATSYSTRELNGVQSVGSFASGDGGGVFWERKLPSASQGMATYWKN